MHENENLEEKKISSSMRRKKFRELVEDYNILGLHNGLIGK